jgi:hypothetical protein
VKISSVGPEHPSGPAYISDVPFTRRRQADEGTGRG